MTELSSDGANSSGRPLPPRAARGFVLRFAVVSGVLLALYYFPFEGMLTRGLRHLYLSAYARVAGAAVGLMDPGVHVEGTHIMGRVSLDFGLSCDAMESIFCLPLRPSRSHRRGGGERSVWFLGLRRSFS